MTTATTTPRVAYTADGSTVSYTFNFEIADSSSIAVYEGSTKKTLTTHYTVSFDSGSSGTGSIVFGSAPSDAVVITLVRDTNLARTTDFAQSGAFLAGTVNAELDRLSQAVIDATDKIENRAISTTEPNTDTATMTIPAAADRANKVLSFDGSGNAQTTTDAGGTVTSVGLTTSGDDLTITSTPVTTSGNIGIALASPITTNVTGNLTGNVTGNLTTDGISINDNKITTTRSNDDLILDAAGTGTIDMGGSRVKNLTTSSPIADGDAATKKYVDDSFGSISGTTISSGTTNVSVASTSITGTVSGATLFTGNAASGFVVSNNAISTDGVTINDNKITASRSNDTLELATAGSGKIVLDGLSWPSSDGTSNYVLKTDGSGTLSWTENTGSTTGDLTFVGSTITAPSNADLTLDPSGTGTIELNATTNVTGDLTTSAISLVDNKISANRSNDYLELSGNGTGRVNITGGASSGAEATSGQLSITDTTGQHLIFGDSWSHGSQGSTIQSGNSEQLRIRGGTGNQNVWIYSGALNVIGSDGLGASIVVGAGSGSAGLYGDSIIKTATNSTDNKGSDLQLRPGMDATTAGDIVALGLRIGGGHTGTTITADATNASVTLQGNGTGGVILDGITAVDNTLSTNASNANLELSANGSGTVEVQTDINVTGAITATTSIANDAIKIDDHTISGLRSNDNIIIDPAGTGDILLGNFRFDVDQSVASGQDNYVLTYDDSSGKISLEASAGGVSLSGSTNNTIATVTGSNALIGEANATFDGSTLGITGNITASTTIAATTAITAGTSITATTSIGNDAITIDDHNITTTRSNDALNLSANGTGRIHISQTGDEGLSEYAATHTGYGSAVNDMLKGVIIHDRIVDQGECTSNATRQYRHGLVSEWKLATSINSSNTHNRFRNYLGGASMDMNGSSMTNSGSTRGLRAIDGAANVTNTAAGTATLGNMVAVEASCYATGAGGLLTVTNAVGLSASTGVASWGGDDVTITNAYGLKASTYDDGDSGTRVITNSYGVYVNSMFGTNKWAFYDNTNGQSLFGDVKINQNTISTSSSNANLELGTSGTGTIELQADTNVTGAITATTNISTDAIQLVDNKISASRSNDTIYLQPSGTGVVNVGNADWYGDFGGLISGAYGSTGRLKGNAMYYVDEAIVPGADRTYANWIQTSLKTNGADTTSSNARFRNICVMALDINGSSITHSSLSRGAQAMNCTAYITSSSTDDSIISSATGFIGYGYLSPKVDGNLTVTNFMGVKSNCEVDASNLGAGKTGLITNAYGYHYSGNNTYGTGGGGTATITNSYGYYADMNADTGATNWAFYDNRTAGSNSQNRLGAIQLINQASAPTNLADHSWIYALDDSASSEVYVRDEAGNATKISPHNKEGEWEYYSKNSVTGKTVRVNMEALVKEVENLSGKKFIENI